jgi:hypothetical protein
LNAKKGIYQAPQNNPKIVFRAFIKVSGKGILDFDVFKGYFNC